MQLVAALGLAAALAGCGTCPSKPDPQTPPPPRSDPGSGSDAAGAKDDTSYYEFFPGPLDGCNNCGHNSPIINSFRIEWLRSLTATVMRNSETCKPPKGSIVIVAPTGYSSGSNPIGYELKVVANDPKHTVVCSGAELKGLEIQLQPHRHWPHHRFHIYIDDIKSFEVKVSKSDATYRRAYLISEYGDSKSACTHKTPPPILPGDLVSNLDLPHYMLIIPNAEYDYWGAPVTPSSNHLPTPPDGAAEWYEMACGGDALADTESTGMATTDDPKTIRNAALYMFTGKFKGLRTRTITGARLTYARGRAKETGTNDEPTNNEKEHHVVEARWGAEGAVCVNHSRLWGEIDTQGIPTDTPEPSDGTLPADNESEEQYLKRIWGDLPRCKLGPTDQDKDVLFTSYVIGHHDGPFHTSELRILEPKWP